MLPEIVATLDAFPELLVIIESGGSIVATNHRFARTFDGPPESLIGRSLFDLLETHHERTREYLRRCAGTMQPMPGALVFRRSNGAPLECQCSGAALRPGEEFGPRTILLRSRPKDEAVVSFAVLNQKIADLSREVRGRRTAEVGLRELNDSLEQRIEVRTQETRDVFFKLYDSERQFRNLVESVTDYAIFYA